MKYLAIFCAEKSLLTRNQNTCSGYDRRTMAVNLSFEKMLWKTVSNKPVPWQG